MVGSMKVPQHRLEAAEIMQMHAAWWDSHVFFCDWKQESHLGLCRICSCTAAIPYNNIWSSSSDTGFLIASYLDEHLDFHMFVLLFTSFYIFLLFNKPLQSFLSTDVQGERAEGAKGFKWANTSRGLEMWRDRRAWRIVPNSIQILRNSTNFYPISIQFFQLSGDNVTKHDEQDKQDMKKTCDLNTAIYSNIQ